MRSALVVALGAALGAGARWWVAQVVTSDDFPWATLLVNVIGCAAIGWCAATITRRTTLWYFVATGLLGGFTTASTFGVETRRLLDDDRPAIALAYVAASIGLGLVAVSTTRTLAMRRSDP